MKKKNSNLYFLAIVACLVFSLSPSLVSAIESKGYKVDTVQTVTTSNWTQVILDAELFDTGDEFTTDDYRYTAKEAGYRMVTGALSYTNAVADKRYEVAIRKNGAEATKVRIHSSSTTSAGVFIADIIYLGVGDYLELWTWHNFGITKRLGWGSSGVFLAVHKFVYMPDIYTQITNATTDAEFYLDRTISYGDIILIVFLSIFLLFAIGKTIAHFVFNLFGHLK